MIIDEDGYVSDPHMDAEWGSYETDKFECLDCGETFPTESDAKEHLKSAQDGAGFWEMGLPVTDADCRTVAPPEFKDKTKEITANRHTVCIREDVSRTLGVIQGGYKDLIEQSDSQVELPANFKFGEWEMMTGEDSPLTFDDGSPRLSERVLARAVKYLAEGAGATYDPERFSLYPLEYPVLVADEEAVLIAPKEQSE
jgi:hypothetical protein